LGSMIWVLVSLVGYIATHFEHDTYLQRTHGLEKREEVIYHQITWLQLWSHC
jgi:hypothetical protein